MLDVVKSSLTAVAKAFKEYKTQFKKGEDCSALFKNFTRVLDLELKDYQIKYDYICGSDTVNIDGVTTNYALKDGDTVIMDISVGRCGAWCDVTRTFFVGEISREKENAFDLIVKSLRAGANALKAGALASEIYQAVNGVYKSVGKELVHHAGHRIGQSCLLQPQFLPDRKESLFLGDLVAIESGLYDHFGIRLENDFIITADGAEDLFIELMPLNIKEYVLR